MALSFLESQVTTKNTSVLVQENWMDNLEKEAEFRVEYSHSIRQATVLLETKSSNRQNKDNKNYTVFTWDDSKQNATFTAEESFWSNKIRKKSLIEGVQNTIPKALYLLRPETAYVGCMHFLAKELGGAQGYAQQRMFLFNNPGIQLYMTGFWTKLQEIHWSGGMSPGLTENEKHGLVCALIECYCYSQSDTEHQAACLPVPHLQVEMLQKIGVHIPQLERDEDDLTDEAVDTVNKDLTRTNLPGIPTLLTAHIQCDACGIVFTHQKELKEHRKTEDCKQSTTCNGCAIKFTTNTDYMVHRISFCKQGPLSGNKCPVCNQHGPRCLCQVHWKRTYETISKLWENDYNETAWVTKNPVYSGIIQMAKPYLNMDLVEEPEQQPAKPQTPNPIKHTEWEKQQQLIPLQYYQEGDDTPKLKMSNEKYLDLNKLLETLEKGHKMKITQLRVNPIKSPPKSIKKQSRSTQLFYSQLMQMAATNPQEATPKRIEGVKKSIAEMVEFTKDDNGVHLAETLDIDRQKLMDSILTIEEWAKKASNAIKNTEPRTLAKTLDFNNMSRSGVSSTDNLATLDNQDEEYPTQGLIFNQRPSGYKEESNGAPPPTGLPPGHPLQRSGEGYTNGDIQRSNIFDQNDQDLNNLLSSTEHRDNGPYYCINEDHLKENPPYRTFKNIREKDAHLSKNHRCPFRESQNCPFFYELNVELGKHIQTRHPESKDSYCDICNDRVPAAHLDTHMEQMHIKCPSCKSWYLNPVELRDHWATDGGTCQSPITNQYQTAEKKATPVAPDTITMANLAEGTGNTDNYVATAIIDIAKTVFPHNPEGQAKIQELTEKMRAHAFQTQRREAIARNPYTAQAQATNLLRKPNFNHPAELKERSIEKVLEKARRVDLSVQTKNSLENFLIMSRLNQDITALTKQLYLREQAATFLLASYLGDTCKRTLHSVYRRPATDLSYSEVLSCLQRHFYNIDLSDFRESIRVMKRSQGEPLIKFYNRAFELADIGAANFEDGPKQEWIESLMRELVYRALDINLKAEVDTLETIHAHKMDSRELLRMHTDKSISRAPPLEADDTIMNIGLISERRTKNGLNSKAPRQASTRVQAPRAPKKVFATRTFEAKQYSRPRNTLPARKAPAKVRLITRSGLDTGENRANSWRTQSTVQPRPPNTNTAAQVPQKALSRQPYPTQNNSTRGRPVQNNVRYNQTSNMKRPQSKPSDNSFRPRSQSTGFRRPQANNRPQNQAPKQTRVEATQLMMKKLRLTNEIVARVGLHCWACGKGRSDLGGEYHKRTKCKFPIWKGEAHECKKGIFLMHQAHLCPYKNSMGKRVSKIRLED